MYEKSINEAELVLSVQKDSSAPVHKVWEEVVHRSKQQRFEVASLADFSAMLEGDRRFQIIPAQRKSQSENAPEEVLNDDEMERMGFFSEDQVKLRSVHPAARILQEEDEEIGSIRRRAFVSGSSNGTAPKEKIKTASARKKSSAKKKTTPRRKEKNVTGKKKAKKGMRPKRRGKK